MSAADHLNDCELGTRVVVRYLIEDGERATDVIGTLTRRTDAVLTVHGKAGTVDIPLADVVAGKRVPPPPTRKVR